MKWTVAVFALVLAVGCVPYSMIEPQLRRESAEMMACPEGKVTISSYVTGTAGSSPSTWTAEGCDRTWRCSLWAGSALSSVPDRRECQETAESEARTVERVARDRLSLETGCPEDQVKLTRKAEWRRGTETAYRFSACGRAYVCTTAAGRTDCKAALSD